MEISLKLNLNSSLFDKHFLTLKNIPMNFDYNNNLDSLSTVAQFNVLRWTWLHLPLIFNILYPDSHLVA